ncbi:MAG TPA: metallophosphoesterase [Terracidiphilus sp.]|nr:metallophosphoesterase [Terracidiphilus sp.]
MTATALGAAGLAFYSGEIARHRIEITQPEIRIPNLPPAFDGFRIAQLSDIHLDEFTEPFFLREAISHINGLQPDAVFLTGDFITYDLLPRKFPIHSAWKCARILETLACKQRYAVLGNHDVVVSPSAVIAALTASNISVLRNGWVPLERGASRLWLAGVDDPLEGHPDLDRAIPAFMRQRTDEPILLLCHEPDFADTVLTHPAGPSVALMLSGHTHGGQVRLPLLGAMELPELGRKYVEGLFQLQSLQLYVNRGIGTVGLPFRLNCPPEITSITLRRA